MKGIANKILLGIGLVFMSPVLLFFAFLHYGEKFCKIPAVQKYGDSINELFEAARRARGWKKFALTVFAWVALSPLWVPLVLFALR
jgi:hypothetical protein